MVGYKKIEAEIEFDPAPLEKLQRPRSYSQLTKDGRKETWDETCDRTLYSPHLGLKILGKFTDEEIALIDKYQRSKKAFGSARWLWVGGTPWIEKPENAGAAFNCTSFRLHTIDTFGMLMDLAMMGSGTGAVLELDCIDQLPPVVNELRVIVVGEFGEIPKESRSDITTCYDVDGTYVVSVGDSRQGWVQAYQELINLAVDNSFPDPDRAIQVAIDIRSVRPSGERLKGFGGVANPVKLPDMFRNVASVLNGAIGRKLNGLECCLLLGHAASAVVAGNIRRSAGMKQGSPEDESFTTSKDNLYVQDESGKWIVDPKRSTLTTANHTIVYHHKPTLEEITAAVTKQFYFGEGAIQYAPEAIARANVDLLDTPEKKKRFLDLYSEDRKSAGDYLALAGMQVSASGKMTGGMTKQELDHRMHRYALNPLILAA